MPGIPSTSIAFLALCWTEVGRELRASGHGMGSKFLNAMDQRCHNLMGRNVCKSTLCTVS